MSSDAFIKCFKCSQYFNEEDRLPLNLKCGDTLCKKCIEDIVNTRETKCPICNKENKLNKNKISKLPQNKQILIALQDKFGDNEEEEMAEYDLENQTSSISSSYYYEKCTKHPDKRIEYFCRDCTMVVCVVCIYSHHNGHHLSILEDMGTIIKQNINDFSKMLKNVFKINEENFQTVQNKYIDIKELKEQQMKIVEKSFDEIRNILEEKKVEILNTFNIKYLDEEKKIAKLETLLKNNLKDFERITLINEELITYSEGSNDAKILKKIDDITDFLHKSFADLNRIHKNEISIKTELTFDLANLKPIVINTKNLISLIEKINAKTICYESHNVEQVKNTRNKDNEVHVSKYLQYNKNPSQNESNTELDVTKNKNWSRIEDNISISIDERKNIDTPKVPKPRRVLQEHKNRIKSANPKRDVGSEIDKSVTDDSINIVKLPFIKSQGKEKSKKIDDFVDMSAVFAIGDNKFILKYYLEDNYWQMIDIDESVSSYKGNLRYCSVCYISNQRMILTGGCSSKTNEAVNTCYEFSTNNMNKNIKIKSMIKKRYSHSSIYLKECVYVIGGFDNKDDDNVAPSTLKSCERYTIQENKWTPIAQLNQSRAFSGVAAVNNSTLYVFGGFYIHDPINSIERYDIEPDTWVTYFLKLPEKLAKLGVSVYKNNIIILGGINQKYENEKSAWILDLKSSEWGKLPSMQYPRSFNQSSFFYNNYIYVMGGNSECNCERFSFTNGRWQLIESYTSVMKSKKINELYNFSFAGNF